MLGELGYNLCMYNPYRNPLKYGLADPEILNNTEQLARDNQFWQWKKEQLDIVGKATFKLK